MSSLPSSCHWHPVCEQMHAVCMMFNTKGFWPGSCRQVLGLDVSQLLQAEGMQTLACNPMAICQYNLTPILATNTHQGNPKTTDRVNSLSSHAESHIRKVKKVRLSVQLL